MSDSIYQSTLKVGQTVIVTGPYAGSWRGSRGKVERINAGEVTYPYFVHVEGLGGISFKRSELETVEEYNKRSIK